MTENAITKVLFKSVVAQNFKPSNYPGCHPIQDHYPKNNLIIARLQKLHEMFRAFPPLVNASKAVNKA